MRCVGLSARPKPRLPDGGVRSPEPPTHEIRVNERDDERMRGSMAHISYRFAQKYILTLEERRMENLSYLVVDIMRL